MNNLKHFETGIEYKEPSQININQKQSETYIDSIIESNNLPFKDVQISYSDNYWDFSSHSTLNVANKDLKFNFKRVKDNFRLELKKYVLIKILENKTKITSIKRSFSDLAIYFNFLHKCHIYNIKDVNHIILKDFLNIRKKISALALRSTKKELKYFYNYYAANYSDILTPEMNSLLKLNDIRVYKAIRKQNKISDIPKEYFDKLIQTIVKIIDNPDEPEHIRTAGCIILLLSQTGLRISEVLALEADSLETINVLEEEETNYIRYKTWKREKGNNSFSYEKTYVNSLTKKAFKKLLDLHSKRRNKIKSKYLYMGNLVFKKNKDCFPVDANAFLGIQKQFYFYIDKYLPTIDLDKNNRKNLHTTKFSRIKADGSKSKTLTYPKTQQYRVHACTELYHKGVPLQYIRKFMGHLSSNMEGYYVRPKNQVQEDIAFSKKTIKDILTGKLKLLGSNAKDLTNKIKTFINENKFSIHKDLDAITESLMNKIPIRQKMGGVCIKSSVLRDCSLDAKTNDFYCAYGVCPNVFHFYYNIDISYRKAKELSQSIKINTKNNFIKQV